MSILRRSSLRHFIRHPLQLALAITGIALGVAIVVAVDVSTASARRAFEWSTRAVFGQATHQLVAGSVGMPDSLYRVVRVELGLEASPVIEANATLIRAAGERSVRWLGLDPFVEAPFRPYLDAGVMDAGLNTLLTRPGAVVVPRGLAQELSLGVGDSIRLRISGTERRAWVAGVVEAGDEISRRALSDLVLSDIAVAQELADRVGRLDRIDLILSSGEAGAREAEQIRSRLPGLELVDAAARAEATAGMTRAFELNLNAFALITLVFGALLIYDTMSFSVVQRREWIGRLRALGVTRREIAQLILTESLGMGAVGTLLGLAAGLLLARALVGLVLQTINDFYFAVSVTDFALSPAGALQGILLGIGATLLATLGPLREATSTLPRMVLARSILESRAALHVNRAARGGVLLLLIGLGLTRVQTTDVALGFTALFAIVLGAAMLAPIATVGLLRVIRPAAAALAGALGNLAVRGLTGTLSRTGPAVAALMVAVAVGAAVSMMVSSFRGSVEQWLSESLQADVYISAPSGGGGRREGRLQPEVVQEIVSQPGVAGVTRYRQASVPFRDGELRLVALDLYARHRDSFTFLDGEASRAWPAFDAGGLLVSESFAFRNRVGAGDTVRVTTERGPHAFPIAAVYRDYSSEFGVAFLDRRIYDALWSDRGVSSLALWLEPGHDADALVRRLQATAWPQELFFRSNRGLRENTLQIFDRTFMITRVLRTLAVLVAFAGVLSALMALQLERTRELGVLRATGCTPGQIWGLVTAQTGLLGLAAGLLAMPLSIALAGLLIHVVNRRAFGWTMTMHFDAGSLLQAVTLAVTAALIAGVYPALRMAKTPPAAALREE
jgi:putative ABC transport system permease protein